MYSERIPNVGYAAYRQAFTEWLLAYPERTKRTQDCLVKFDVYFVSDTTPPPGSRGAPTPLERTSFMTYRAPHDGPCQPLPSQPTPAPVAAH
jgi:hypothetical protein